MVQEQELGNHVINKNNGSEALMDKLGWVWVAKSADGVDVVHWE